MTTFPASFVWGAATASYQIEGAALEDGKGLSIWDVFCRRPGAIYEGHTGEAACDHYHRFRQDVALMKAIGLKGYRFSISWPRLLPEGTGKVNPQGLAFYEALVDALLEAGIQPWITLYHWDLPYALYLRGGWLNPDMPNWFAEYVRLVVERLSDRVTHWMTLNEIQVFVGMGHRDGRHAPGLRLDWPEVLRIGHHALLAHGRAVQVVRAFSRQPAQIGWAPAGLAHIPASESEADIQAARQAMFEMTQPGTWNNVWWADPVIFGRYPEDGLRAFGAAVPDFPAADMDVIATPIDFYGVNCYFGFPTRAGQDGRPEPVPQPPGSPVNLYYWHINFDVLYWAARFLYERYQKPIVITENGLGGMDWVHRDGRVHDPQRIDYTARHLAGLKRALQEEIPVQGYFHWSVMDNFEWQEGYRQRFGLIYVDFVTQQRILKDSAYWYRDVIRSQGAEI